MKTTVLWRASGLVVLAVLFAVSGGAGDPHLVDLSNRLAPPSFDHPFGTDHLGRDLATRLFWGAVPSLIAVVIVLIGGIVMGVVAGAMIALGPSSIRAAASWLAETVLALPTLVTALVLAALFGAGPITVAMALLVTSWAPYALTIAALFDGVRGQPYWQASQAMGTPVSSAVRRHMLPNVWPAIGALAGADAGRAVILVASLGFIGLTADTGRPEWGAMIHEYRMFLFTEPRLVLAPVIFSTCLCLGLHMALDPSKNSKLRF